MVDAAKIFEISNIMLPQLNPKLSCLNLLNFADQGWIGDKLIKFA